MEKSSCCRNRWNWLTTSGATSDKITSKWRSYHSILKHENVAQHHIAGLVQDCSISSALAKELLLSCTKPLIHWRNVCTGCHWLYWKLSKNQLPVHSVTEISSKWLHFRFSVEKQNYFILAWWGHKIETPSTLLALYVRNKKKLVKFK